MKINWMALIRTLTFLTTAFERMEKKLYGFRQTEEDISDENNDNRN